MAAVLRPWSIARMTWSLVPRPLVGLRATLARRHRSEAATDVVLDRDASGRVDVDKLLSQPSWSVASLLPPAEFDPATSEVTPKQLHHLLRLSALPPPRDAQDETRMLSTLAAQLHFVRQVQQVDTTGVEPLRSLRDETASGEKAAELGLDALRDALAAEEIRGPHRRVRRGREVQHTSEEAPWDPLSTASNKTGRFFIVQGGKDG